MLVMGNSAPPSVTQIGCPPWTVCRHRHRRDDPDGTERIEQPERRERAAAELGDAAHDGPRTRGLQALRLDHRLGAFHARPTERPEQLLRSVARHETTDHQTKHQRRQTAQVVLFLAYPASLSIVRHKLFVTA